jgi:hypothetical protein
MEAKEEQEEAGDDDTWSDRANDKSEEISEGNECGEMTEGNECGEMTEGGTEKQKRRRNRKRKI